MKLIIKKSPKNLKHKPIVSVNNYEEIDAMTHGHSDAKALSIGRSSWDNGNISLKIWRHSGKRWSRQSEEMPIHRCLDLAILFLACLQKDKDLPYPTNSLPLTIDDNDDFNLIREFYACETNRKHIDARLYELRNLLNEWYNREGVNHEK